VHFPKGYLPGQLYNLDASTYGKGIDLKNLLDVLHKYGISGIADIVINHRTAGQQDHMGRWNIFEGGVLDKRLAWGAWAVSYN
jgi:alpha-amylase